MLLDTDDAVGSPWRVRFLLNLGRIFVLPPFLLHAALKYTDNSVPWFVTPVLYPLSIAVYVKLHSFYWKWYIARQAAKLGARPVPVAKGKWIGNVDLLIRIMQTPKKAYVGQRILEIMDENNSTTINIRPLWTDLIFTADHGAIKEILATGFNKWGKGFMQRERMAFFLGNGIFNVDGKEWKRHRAMTRPFLAKERISDFETFWKHALTTFDKLGSISQSEIPVLDVQDLFGRFTMDSASDFLFGKDIRTLYGQYPIPGQAKLGVKGSSTEDSFGGFVTAFEEGQMMLSMRTVRGVLWPAFELFNDKGSDYMKVIYDYLDPLIAAAQEENLKREKAGLQGAEDMTLLQELVKTTEDSGTIRDELLSIMLAGRDTTAALLTFTLYLLALHPDVETKLRAEIVATCGMEPPTYEAIRKMKYLRNVLDEVLRLFPSVPLNTRMSAEDTTLPASDHPGERPYFIPGQTAVAYSTILMQRNEALWGPTAQDFDPSRWADQAKVASYHQNFQFVPFNAGPRICPGQNFAYNEASFVISVLLPRFSFSLAPEYQPEGSLPLPEWKDNKVKRFREEKVWPLSSVTIYAKGGVWMRVKQLTEV